MEMLSYLLRHFLCCALTSLHIALLSYRTKLSHAQTVSSIKNKEQILFWKNYKTFYKWWMLKKVALRGWLRDILRTWCKKQNKNMKNMILRSSFVDPWSGSGEVSEWRNRHHYTKLLPTVHIHLYLKHAKIFIFW